MRVCHPICILCIRSKKKTKSSETYNLTKGKQKKQSDDREKIVTRLIFKEKKTQNELIIKNSNNLKQNKKPSTVKEKN